MDVLQASPEDLESLFGVDIHEMQPYRPLPEQIAEQLHAGRTIIVELDSWYLPDTASTSYRSEHVKSSIAADAIDVDAQTLRYFHGPGMFELSGEDYRGVFRIGEFSDDVLAPVHRARPLRRRAAPRGRGPAPSCRRAAAAPSAKAPA